MSRTRGNQVFGNTLLRSPDGIDMCRCNDKIAQWYLDKGLAEEIQSDPPILRLLFEPKGNGHAGDPFYLQERKNECVVCGSIEHLTLHHMVPGCYRKYFPTELKSARHSEAGGRHWFYDTMVVCISCHELYEHKHAYPFKGKLAEQIGVPPDGIWHNVDYKTAVRVTKAAVAIKRYGENIPEAKLQALYSIVQDYYDTDVVTEEQLQEATRLFKNASVTTASELVVKQLKTVEDFDRFFVMWRRHFAESMQPKHMPEYWEIDRNVCSEPDVNGKQNQTKTDDE